jgi:predicted Zn-dependent protease
MKSITAFGLAAFLLSALPASAQFGRVLDGVQKAADAKDKLDDLNFTDAEEQELGEKVSTMLREKYGVVQDKAVHTYVTLVGSVLAQSSSRPSLKWTFIVLDTDGVNAFAAPGGLVHITRGALALVQNESELAGVLGHEISHVTAKHTIRAIQKNKAVQLGAKASKNALIEQVANKAYEMVLENAYDRGDEMDADKNGIALSNKAGYAAGGLGAFLTRLADRNKDLKDRSGLFASHPESQARIDALGKLIAAQKLTASATVAPRYRQFIPYKPVPVTQVASGSQPAPAKSAETKTDESKPSGGKFGVSGMSPLGHEKSSTQSVSSAGSRGVNPDRDAKGGSNSTLVTVTVSASQIEEFRKGIV